MFVKKNITSLPATTPKNLMMAAIPRIFMPAPFCLGQKEAKFCRFYNHKTKVTFTCKEEMEEEEGGRKKKNV